MNLPDKIQKSVSKEKIFERIYSSVVGLAIVLSRNKALREIIVNLIIPLARHSVYLSQRRIVNKRILQDKVDMMLAVIYSAFRSNVHRKTVKILMKKVFLNQEANSLREKFRKENGFVPPAFITISPGKQCNLRCPYCYANSANEKEKLSYEVFSRIIAEAKCIWGIHFFVISGGEPFLWEDKGFTLLDIAEMNQDCLFLVFTNGVLLWGDRLNSLLNLGNILPAISVEGMEQRTDARRGNGIFKRITTVMKNLKENCIPFGISITATAENYTEVLADEFINFYFKKMGASFGWIFHYMPIGREPQPSLMPQPEQRLWMWQRTWDIIRKEKIVLVDFWNHGTVSSGCISAAKPGGYFYVDWNGNIMPCVFFPYTTMNINEIYKNGGTVNEILKDPFFKEIRNWQDRYGADGNVNSEINWLMPCPIRDHHCIAREIINKYSARLCEGNDSIIDSKEYINEMIKFNKDLKSKAGITWYEEYIQNG
jgi:MoaA/NifB/PqqE/SkfB family radical SAM enzyme